MLEIETLNEILSFIDTTSFVVESKIVESGQRVVYKAKKLNGNHDDCFVLKTSSVYPTNVARIQRELKILNELNCSYFPKSHYSRFISDEDIKYFIDNFDPKTQEEEIKRLKSLNLKPFFVTIENYIEHLSWDDLRKIFKQDEGKFVTFLKKTFEALNLLWNKKIVHRDLKPDNILVNTSLEPTIIDLGIAKSLRDGTELITHPFMPSPCTPQFAAPEQLSNSKTAVTYKSDQFSIGVISFWVVTGIFPFGILQEIGPDGVLKKHIKESPG